ncbi:MAG: NUDIX domain-containing protein, partial [Solobacterium sp.]|nr:NUDIX domain-containing protein [Solobacterium sp.]
IIDMLVDGRYVEKLRNLTLVYCGSENQRVIAPEAALKREIEEELATEIEVGDYLTTIEHDYPDFHLSMRCYWCRIIAGAPVLKEHEAARWLSADELDSVAWLPADITIIDRIRSVLQEEE